MKQRLITLFLLLSTIGIATSACRVVEPGYEAVKVRLGGNDKGTHEVLPSGRYWFQGPNVTFYHFPVFEQNYVYTRKKEEGSPHDESITFQDKDGLEIGLDVGVRYTISNTGKVFGRYRRGIDELTNEFVYTEIRNAFQEHGAEWTAEEIYSDKKSELLDLVDRDVKDAFANDGVSISGVYLIGSLRLPPAINAAIESKITATTRAQQRENEKREAIAQAEIDREKAQGKADAVLIAAKAEAEALKIRRQQLSRDIIEWEAIKKWNGTLPTYNGGGAVPFVNLN